MIKTLLLLVLLIYAPLAALAQSKPAGGVLQDCRDCPAMVVIPGGSFMMGSPDDEAGRKKNEGPRHRVAIASFAVSETPITVAQWAAFAKKTGHRTEENPYSDTCRSGIKAEFDQTDTHPVVCVSWNDAQRYVQWLSAQSGKKYRLLSEAEWEYAARAGTEGPYPFPSDSISTSANHGNDKGGGDAADGYTFTSPVKTYPANSFGLYDMIGNVWEWTQDCYHEDQGYDGAPNNGAAWVESKCDKRVMRGGSFDSAPRSLRAASRGASEPDNTGSHKGLRVARTAP